MANQIIIDGLVNHTVKDNALNTVLHFLYHTNVKDVLYPCAGTVYSFRQNLDSFKVGDRVRVIGKLFGTIIEAEVVSYNDKIPNLLKGESNEKEKDLHWNCYRDK